MHGDIFVCLSDDEGLKHIDRLLKSKYTAFDKGTLGFEESDAKSLLFLNRVFRVGTDDRGPYLDVEPNLTDARTTHHQRDQDATQRRNPLLHRARSCKTSWCFSKERVRF